MKTENELKQNNTPVAGGDFTLSGETIATETQVAPVETPKQEQEQEETTPVAGVHGVQKPIEISHKPKVGEPVTRPIIIAYDAARLLIKQSAIRHKREIERYIEAGGISVVFDKYNRVFNTFNAYTERFVFGLLCELDRQSENGLSEYINYVKQCKQENKPFEAKNKKIEATNKAIAKWNATHPNQQKTLLPLEPLPNDVPISTTRGSNGGHIAGYDLDRFTPDEWASIADLCQIERGEPFVVVDIPTFARDWFGIEDVQGKQYELFRRIISDLGKTDFVYLDNDKKEYLRTQLFTTWDGALHYTNEDEKKKYAVVKVNKLFLRHIGDKFLKAPENMLRIAQQFGGNMGIRLFLYFTQVRTDVLNQRGRRGRNAPIVKPCGVRELILETADEPDIVQRKWRKTENMLYEQLEMLKRENVLLDYTQREFNTDGMVTVTINPQPFTRKVEILNE